MKEKIDTSIYDEKIKKALIKKALGYDATEVVEEFVSGEEGEIKLTKKKITKKNVPPDLTAIKMLTEENKGELTLMSDEELEIEKQRLEKILVEKFSKKGVKS
jgi:hypothetical protein